jgi:hypothetical protein
VTVQLLRLLLPTPVELPKRTRASGEQQKQATVAGLAVSVGVLYEPEDGETEISVRMTRDRQYLLLTSSIEVSALSLLSGSQLITPDAPCLILCEYNKNNTVQHGNISCPHMVTYPALTGGHPGAGAASKHQSAAAAQQH